VFPDLMIDFSHAVIAISRFQNRIETRKAECAAFGRKAQERLGAIDRVDVLYENRRVGWRFGAPASFVIHEKERAISFDGAAEGRTELILAERVGLRLRQQERTGVYRIILQILVHGAVKVVRAGFSDDIDDAAQRAPVLGAETVVDNAKFAH